jgi:8-oxo-dGTP diphosphatase
MRGRIVEVVGAVLVDDGRILAARRGPAMSQPDMWEFPGGKIEAGESPEQALRRELIEELGCTVEVGERLESTTHVYDFGVVTLTTYFCRLMAGVPEPTEHSELRWVAPEALGELDWAPADIPAVQYLQSAGLPG